LSDFTPPSETKDSFGRPRLFFFAFAARPQDNCHSLIAFSDRKIYEQTLLAPLEGQRIIAPREITNLTKERSLSLNYSIKLGLCILLHIIIETFLSSNRRCLMQQIPRYLENLIRLLEMYQPAKRVNFPHYGKN
jgi:hypothetical protein